MQLPAHSFKSTSVIWLQRVGFHFPILGHNYLPVCRIPGPFCNLTQNFPGTLFEKNVDFEIAENINEPFYTNSEALERVSSEGLKDRLSDKRTSC